MGTVKHKISKLKSGRWMIALDGRVRHNQTFESFQDALHAAQEIPTCDQLNQKVAVLVACGMKMRDIAKTARIPQPNLRHLLQARRGAVESRMAIMRMESPYAASPVVDIELFRHIRFEWAFIRLVMGYEHDDAIQWLRRAYPQVPLESLRSITRGSGPEFKKVREEYLSGLAS